MGEPISADRRVVITGLGLITPLGQTPDALWSAFDEGRSGVAALAQTGSMPVSYAATATEFTGEIANFGELDGEKKKAIRKGLKLMCRESQMGVAAAQRAVADAKLADGSFDPERVGVVFGSDYMLSAPDDFVPGIRQCIGEKGFEFSRWADAGMPQLTPLWLLKYLPNMPASHIAIYNDYRGPNNSLTLREAAANLAIGEAFRVIRRGHADIMVAGATGTRVHPMKSIHAALQEELALNGESPAAASRPFDLNRAGMVLGEGAGSIVIESLASAQKRGARIYAEIVGFGASIVADRKLVARRDQALANSMRAALRDASADPKEVGHIQAHGLGTRTCDEDEAKAINDVFGPASRDLPVTAAKSYFGNLGAGSGVVELIAGTLALTHDRLFPILNYQTPDPACPIRAVTRRDERPGESFFNLSVTPQGQAAAILVRRFVA